MTVNVLNQVIENSFVESSLKQLQTFKNTRGFCCPVWVQQYKNIHKAL